MFRHANDATEGKEFKMFQFSYNLGRVRELLQLDEATSRDCWWRRFELLLTKKDYDGIISLISSISETLELEVD